MLEWVHSWMSPLPLWLQFIIGIGSLVVLVFAILLFQRYMEWSSQKFKDLSK